jgi:hypothetical protein
MFSLIQKMALNRGNWCTGAGKVVLMQWTTAAAKVNSRSCDGGELVETFSAKMA